MEFQLKHMRLVNISGFCRGSAAAFAMKAVGMISTAGLCRCAVP